MPATNRKPQLNRKFPKIVPKPSFERHSRKCLICHHPDRAAIEAEFVDWDRPHYIAHLYDLGDERTVYRHAHAAGLTVRRRENLHSVLDSLLEKVHGATVSGDCILRTIRAYSCVDRMGRWVDPPTQVNFSTIAAPASSAAPALPAPSLSGRPILSAMPLHSAKPAAELPPVAAMNFNADLALDADANIEVDVEVHQDKDEDVDADKDVDADADVEVADDVVIGDEVDAANRATYAFAEKFKRRGESLGLLNPSPARNPAQNRSPAIRRRRKSLKR